MDKGNPSNGLLPILIVEQICQPAMIDEPPEKKGHNSGY